MHAKKILPSTSKEFMSDNEIAIATAQYHYQLYITMECAISYIHTSGASIQDI